MAKRIGTGALLAKKALRQIKGEWKQFLSIFLMGAIAMTLFVGLFSNADSLSNRVDEAYEEGEYPSLFVFTSSHAASDLDGLRSLLDEGDEIDSRLELSGKAQGKGVYFALTDGFPELSKPYNLQGEVGEDFFLVDYALGEEASALTTPILLGKQAEITLPLASFGLSSYAELLASYVKPGKQNILASDELSFFLTPTGYMDNPENLSVSSYSSSTICISKDYFLSGILSEIEDNYDSSAVALINQTITSLLGDNLYLIKLKDESKLDSLKAKIEDYFGRKAIYGGEDNLLYVLSGEQCPWASNIEVEVSEATSLCFLFPAVFFFVALLVILTTFSQIIIKERLQIGTMKAMGVSQSEIRFHYSSMVAVLLLLSSVFGFVAGPLIIPAIMGQKYDILYSLPARGAFVFPTLPALLSCLIFLAAGVACALFATHKELRLLPSESMRAAPIHFKGRGGEVKEAKPKASRLSAKMALRNIRSALFKSFMVVAGVAGCAALLLCGFGIEDTIDYGIDNDIALAYNGDVTGSYAGVSYQKTQSYFDLPGIAKVEQSYLSSGDIKSGEKTFLSSVRLFEADHPCFDVEITPGTVAISLKVAEQLGVEIGDEVSFPLLSKTATAKVGAIYRAFSVNGVAGLYSDFFADGQYPYNYATITAEPRYSEESIKQEIIDSDSASMFASVQTKQEVCGQIESITSGIKVMTNAVKVFAILLALVVLYNLALLNFRYRQRDIATLKVLGFSKSEIGLSLTLESAVLSIVGFAIGSLLGFPFMYATLKVNEVSLVRFLYHISLPSYIYAFLLTFIVAIGVNVLLSLYTGRVKMVESLKSVE